MTDTRPNRPQPDTVGQPAPRPTRNVPPLAWIIAAILAACIVAAVVQRGGSDRTPQGGSAPRQAEGTAYMPAAPANGSAPATPAGAVNGPNEPASSDAAPPPK
jgi:hypothetical protein